MMTDAHATHLSHALDLIQQSAAKTPPQEIRFVKSYEMTVGVQASLSLCAESIAQALSDAQHLTVGAEPRPLRELTPVQAAFFRARAEQAIDALDAESVRESVDYAINETVNGVYRERLETDMLIRKGIEAFLEHRATPKVAHQSEAGCEWCGREDADLIDYYGEKYHRDCYNDAAEARNVR